MQMNDVLGEILGKQTAPGSSTGTLPSDPAKERSAPTSSTHGSSRVV